MDKAIAWKTVEDLSRGDKFCTFRYRIWIGFYSIHKRVLILICQLHHKGFWNSKFL